MLALFGDLATELLIRLDGDEGLFRAYENVEFLAPVFAGDYVEAAAELVAIGNTSRKIRFEARKVVSNLRLGRPRAERGRGAGGADRRRSRGGHLRRRPRSCSAGPGSCTCPACRRVPPRTPSPSPPRPVPEDVILTAAIVGAELTRAQTPHLPITPAGGGRRGSPLPRGRRRRHPPSRPQRRRHPTRSPAARFAEVIDAVRRKCDCIIQPSTGGAVGMSIDERSGPLACKPEMATLNCGTINFGDDVFVNSRPDIRALAAKIRASGAMPELECYEVGHVEEALSLAAEGDIGKPLHFQFVLGVKGAIPAREDVVALPAVARPCRRHVGRRGDRALPAADDRARDAARRTRARGARGQHLPRQGRCSRRAARRWSRARPRTRGRSGARLRTRRAPGSCSASALPRPRPADRWSRRSRSSPTR